MASSEVTWAYDFSLNGKAYQFRIIQNMRTGETVGGAGDYYTNTYCLPVPFGQWKLIGFLYTYAHSNFNDAFKQLGKIQGKITDGSTS